MAVTPNSRLQNSSSQTNGWHYSRFLCLSTKNSTAAPLNCNQLSKWVPQHQTDNSVSLNCALDALTATPNCDVTLYWHIRRLIFRSLLLHLSIRIWSLGSNVFTWSSLSGKWAVNLVTQLMVFRNESFFGLPCLGDLLNHKSRTHGVYVKSIQPLGIGPLGHIHSKEEIFIINSLLLN